MEPVSVGIFFKTSRVFVSLRPHVRFVALSFGLGRSVEHARISRRMQGGGHTFHVVRLHGPDDVDDTVKDWLTEAYQTFPG